MSRSRTLVAVIVLAILLSSAANARVHLGIGRLLGARFAVTRLFSLGGLHRAHSFARHGHIRRASLSVRNPGSSLSDPAVRGQIAAAAALAGWHGGRTADGWWRHGDGEYGWVGPLFWPFAYDDIYDYTMWGEDLGFWDYGFADIYAGIFAPYSNEDLASYMAPLPRGRRHGRVARLSQLCNGRETARFPVDQIERAIEPTEAQRAALDELADASTTAGQTIRASCPTQTASTAPARLAVMQQRIEAMIKAELALQPPLQKFYDLLDDEQKVRLNALTEGGRQTIVAGRTRAAPARGCDAAQPAALQWPTDQIEAALHPDDTQRAALHVLQDTSTRALEMLKDVCRPEDAITLPARLAAVDRRLDAMQQAVNLVSAALEDFYDTLSDEQKAQFETIGPKRTA